MRAGLTDTGSPLSGGLCLLIVLRAILLAPARPPGPCLLPESLSLKLSPTLEAFILDTDNLDRISFDPAGKRSPEWCEECATDESELESKNESFN